MQVKYVCNVSCSNKKKFNLSQKFVTIQKSLKSYNFETLEKFSFVKIIIN